jgi:chaperonin cofactor prefoldin
MTYKDYITTVYVIVDEVLKLIEHKHKTNKPKFSDSELITFLVYCATFRKGELKSTLKEFKENYSDMFPYVPNLPAIVKRAKKLMKLVKPIIALVKNLLSNKESLIAILDTKPIPVCELSRIKRCKKVSGKLYKGNNGHKQWFGYKLWLIIDGFEQPVSFNIMPASKHDINALKELKEDKTVIDLLGGKVLIADKAFNSKQLEEELESLNIELKAIKKGKTHHKQKEKQTFLKTVRKKIETTFSRLKYMGIENIKAVSLEGFLTKIHFFILALQFKIILNV